jgi:predicted DNA-binding transcriptional regulator AlpA
MIRKKAGRPALSISPEGAINPLSDLIRGWAGICAEVGKSRVQLWRDIRDDRFPAPVEIGPNAIAWVRAEVDAWKASRPRRTYRAPSAAA